MKWLAGLLVVTAVLFAVLTVVKRHSSSAPERADTAAISAEHRMRVERFWQTYRRATDLRIQGRTAEAATAYAEALALDSTHQDALYYLGNTRLDLGDLAGAERAWRRLVEVDPSNARGHSQLGTLYSCIGEPALLDLEGATREFERALEINREETGPLLHLGEIALMQGDLARARRRFDQVIGSNYSSVAAHVYRAYLAWKAGDDEQAAGLLATAVRHAHGDAPATAVPGEGDTRTGRAPMVAAPTGCRPTRVRMSDLARPEAEVARGADSLYRALDAHLQDARRALRR